MVAPRFEHSIREKFREPDDPTDVYTDDPEIEVITFDLGRSYDITSPDELDEESMREDLARVDRELEDFPDGEIRRGLLDVGDQLVEALGKIRARGVRADSSVSSARSASRSIEMATQPGRLVFPDDLRELRAWIDDRMPREVPYLHHCNPPGMAERLIPAVRKTGDDRVWVRRWVVDQLLAELPEPERSRHATAIPDHPTGPARSKVIERLIAAVERRYRG